MKRLFIILIALLFSFVVISCDSSDDKTDDADVELDEDVEEDEVNDVDEEDVCNPNPCGENQVCIEDEDEDDGYKCDCAEGYVWDEDGEACIEDPSGPTCTLENAWMLPDDDWGTYSYMRMIGTLVDYVEGAQIEDATIVSGRVKLEDGPSYEFNDGFFIAQAGTAMSIGFQQNVIGAVDRVNGFATIDYLDFTTRFQKGLIPEMIQEGVNEVAMGGLATFSRQYVDLYFDPSTFLTEEVVYRKVCWVAVPEYGETEIFGMPYDELPIGGIYGCFDNDQTGADGETLRMMFRNKMTADRAEILEIINARADGTVAELGDPDFMPICECHDEEGVLVDCSVYDGPGGAEDGICRPNPCNDVDNSDGECIPQKVYFDDEDEDEGYYFSGYVCGCEEEYEWDGDAEECVEVVVDPCEDVTCGTNEECVADDGEDDGYKCVCVDGYEWDEDTEECVLEEL